jgi:HK97 family phage prohead protease
VKRSLRGLYVIRGGSAAPSMADRAVAEDVPTDRSAADTTEGLGVLEVNFSTFNTWYRIDSFWEGTFVERTVPGAFKKTLAERGAQNKILFNHGMDFNIGDKPLAVPSEWGERKTSPFLAGELLDTSYNRDLLPGLRAGAYGSSFMFEVLGETWENEPERSDYNPDGLPERTIHEVRTFEAGPVTWPANPDATAGMRSGADWYGEQVRLRDPDQYEDLVRCFSAFRSLNGLRTPEAASVQRSDTVPPAPGQGRHDSGMSRAARQRRLSLLSLKD